MRLPTTIVAFFPLLGVVSSKSFIRGSSVAGRFNATKRLEELLYLDPDYNGARRSAENDGRESYLSESDYFDAEYENDETNQRRSATLDRHDRNLLPEYRSLCEIVIRKIEMNDAEYEYQPPRHRQIFCKSYSSLSDRSDETRRTNRAKPIEQRCAHPGFHCVQRSRTLSMVRRRWEGQCWEPYTKEIASGCDCMWPVSSLGDISAHY